MCFEYNSPKPKTKNGEDRGYMSDCRAPMSNVLELQRTRFHIDKCRRLLLEMLADTGLEAFKPEYATESEICDLRSVFRAQLDAMSMQDAKAIREFLKTVGETACGNVQEFYDLLLDKKPSQNEGMDEKDDRQTKVCGQ